MTTTCRHCGKTANVHICSECHDMDNNLYDAAEALIKDVKKRYSLKSSKDFQCPYMKRIAKLLEDW